MPERPLPELTPEMLLSYGALRELEGARAMQSRSAPEPQVETILGELAVAPPPDEFNISFDRDDTLDSELAGARPTGFRSAAVGARFNVLRPPQHEPFRPPPPVPGPQGGPMREVGRVGRFAILADQTVESPRPDYLAEARARLEDRAPLQPRGTPTLGMRAYITATERDVRLAEQRAAVHETLPTAYDRLMVDDDPFEDDLE